jgi:hypothetical protein
MPFPHSDYCIICDVIRPEVGAKLTIMGFYGLTPNVEVVISDPTQPLNLTMVAGFPPLPRPEGTYSYTISVTRPNGIAVLQTPATPLNVVAMGRVILAVGFAIEPPHVWGRYTIRINVNNALKLDTVFNLRSATANEIAAFGTTPPPRI